MDIRSDLKNNSDFITIDETEVPFKPGETVYEIASRNQAQIPTLCYDPRLEPFGGCRLCVVEIEGFSKPVASCTTMAIAGMVIQTRTPKLEKSRKTLLQMVASENRESQVDPLSGFASQELKVLTDLYGVQNDRFAGIISGKSKQDDNPFILRDYEQCISCYRCVRVCAEQEGDYAISIINRGFKTQIATEFDSLLKDSDCTFCGQCVQTCPTGALADKKALKNATLPEKINKTRSTCPYCGVGCSVDLLTKGDKLVGIHPAMDGPANEGALCIKGQFAYDFVQHPERLNSPWIRDDKGKLKEATWDDALDRAADGFQKVLEKHGRHAIYGIASGRTPGEADYMMQRFIRASFGTNYIDNCSRA